MSENSAVSAKEVYHQLKMSQEELARALGVSFAIINRWENAKTLPFRLAKMNMSIGTIDADIQCSHIFLTDNHRALKADYILTNPSCNDDDWVFSKVKEDSHWVFGSFYEQMSKSIDLNAVIRKNLEVLGDGEG